MGTTEYAQLLNGKGRRLIPFLLGPGLLHAVAAGRRLAVAAVGNLKSQQQLLPHYIYSLSALL